MVLDRTDYEKKKVGKGWVMMLVFFTCLYKHSDKPTKTMWDLLVVIFICAFVRRHVHHVCFLEEMVVVGDGNKRL